MERSPEPELELVRRVSPYGLSAIPLALLAGGLAGGWDTGWSAAIGVAIVVANFAAHGWSVARAARISLAALSVVAAGGFVVRLGVIVAIMFWLNEFAFFSPLAFGLAVVPATIALLGFEMRLIASGVGTQLQVSSEDVKGDVVR